MSSKSKSDYSKDKGFKPWKTPRYLPGSVDSATLDKDLHIYNQHRYNVYAAQTKVDTRPPKYHALKYMKVINIYQDQSRLRQLDHGNKEMLKRINWINRNGGHVDTWNPHAYMNMSNWRLKEKWIKEINAENLNLYKRLLKTKSQYPKEEHDRFWKKVQRKLEYTSKYPHYVIKTKDDELRALPSISEGLDDNNPSARPKCYLEFQIPEAKVSLGRVLIELYTDHAPVAAQQFLQLLAEKAPVSLKNCPVSKIYKDRYLVMRPAQVAEEEVDASIEDRRDLRHCKAGVLSRTADGAFCITFEEVVDLDGKQTAFGKVVRGATNLFKLNDYGRKYGRPIADIVVARCGQNKPPRE